ncbi:MAG: hypothetical protein HQM00_04585 [Magnetococcales bacterium]|nr:hypothetical protein [Magnetococcales bacterium]
MFLLARIVLILWLIALPAGRSEAALSPDQVPEPLKPWVNWVLHGHEESRCPMAHDNAAQRWCAWSSRLALQLEKSQGRFTLQARVTGNPAWLPLPGDGERWPKEVKVNDKPAVVIARGGVPGLWLAPGNHGISGEWSYASLPEFLRIPRETGLITLSVDGRALPLAAPDGEGRLWLHPKKNKERIEDRLELTVHRLVRDGVPVVLESRLELKVAGKPRELLLPPALEEGWIPLKLESPLPVRMEPDGTLRIQTRPGVWTIQMEQRLPGPVSAIARPKERVGPWPEEEAWAFAANHRIRMVAIAGVDAVDPRQTELPKEWREYPAYRMRAGDRMRLVEEKRGESAPVPDRMTLFRKIWLDFSGEGWTIQDHIQGEEIGSWRVEMNPPMALGRVMIDGENQFITRLGDAGLSGVELRQRQVKMVAESRMPRNGGVIPATGWNQDFQKVSGVLNLPPGWQLLHTSGMGSVHESWIGQWSLLDLFLVMVVSLAAGRLWGRWWGAIALVGMTVIHAEAPSLSWNLLAIMAAVGALQVVPAGGWPARLLNGWRLGSIVLLVLTMVPFVVNQARQGLHPQLELAFGVSPSPPVQPAPPSRKEAATPAAPQAQKPERSEEAIPAEAKNQPEKRASGLGVARSSAMLDYSSAVASSGDDHANQAAYRPELTGLDPKSVVQTGPGIPLWTWRSFDLSWNGPVERDQLLHFYLLPPWGNRLVIVARILLILALLGRVLQSSGFLRIPGRRSVGATAAALLMLCGSAGMAEAGEIPDQKMLDTLSARLLEPPSCLPECVTLNRLRLEADAERLRLHLELHAQSEVVVPLPGQAGQWLPAEVLMDGKPAPELRRLNPSEERSGTLWLNLPAGIHQVMMEGVLPAREAVQLVLPLKPGQASSDSKSWKVEGIHDNGTIDSTLQLRRIQTRGPEAQEAEEEMSTALLLPPYLEVERTLTLGLSWNIKTRIRRLTRGEGAVSLAFPLMEGESITTSGIRVQEGKARIQLGSGVEELQWNSTLKIQEKLTLQAGREHTWRELWRVRVGTMWHLIREGIPVTTLRNDQGWHQPEWHPWPGEEVRLTILRPAGVSGPSLTLEYAHLEMRPGEQALDASLQMTLRASHGGQHAIQLPESAKLLSAKVEGREEPFRQDGRQLTLPISPGLRNIQLTWRQNEKMDFRLAPEGPKLGLGGVNVTTRIHLPPDRWILWLRGPTMGPAVLYWGALVGIVLLALGLGRISWLPMRSVHWILLGVGLSTVKVVPAAILVGWFLLMGWRGAYPEVASRWRFNLRQLFLLVWTLAAMISLEEIFRHGLLGYPDMQIQGNFSHQGTLNWFQDRIGEAWPEVEVISLPIVAYRVLMLVWSLWLASALLGWIRWAWGCLNREGLWRAPVPVAESKKPDDFK